MKTDQNFIFSFNNFLQSTLVCIRALQMYKITLDKSKGIRLIIL